MITSPRSRRALTASVLAAAGLAACLSAAASGPPAIYDEEADANAAIRATLAEAEKAKLPVLVVFGANWCGDCRMLDATFKHGPSAPLISRDALDDERRRDHACLRDRASSAPRRPA